MLTLPGDRIFIFVDETKWDGPPPMIGAGALVVTHPITSEIVDAALAALRADPDRRPGSDRFNSDRERRDLKTQERGHFHASADSLNGRSHLARAITARIRGEFKCSFETTTKRADEQAFRLHAMNSILPALRSRRAIRVVFERRSGFDSGAAPMLIEEARRSIDASASIVPGIRSFHPPIESLVAGKAEPGLQVVDLMLWAAKQEKFPSSTKIPAVGSWCGLHCWADGRLGHPPLRWFRYKVNGGDSSLEADDPNFVQPYPVASDGFDDLQEEHLARLYPLAERIIRKYATVALPKHAEHLESDLRHAIRDLADISRVGPAEIQGVARQFLRLFDTLPIYDGLRDDAPIWFDLVHAKQALALTLREDVLHGGNVLDFFAKLRRKLALSAPRELGIS
jgi:hypothetical protein